MRHVRRRFIALGIAAALSVPAGVGISALTAGTAGAVGTTHKISLKGKNPGQSFGQAFENGATLTFQCNDVTGVYKLSLKGVQVIGSDHVSPWDRTYGPDSGRYYVGWALSDATHQNIYTATLNQDTKSGLFTVTSSSTLSDTEPCASASTFQIFGGSLDDGGLSLDMFGGLS